MDDFMRVKYENPKMKQSEVANQLGYSTSISQKYRNDTNMLSPYRINPNNTTNEQKMSQILILTIIHSLTLMLNDLK